jgi:hypothetical protein
MDTFPVETVSSPEVGTFKITVLDDKPVLWNGDYQAGKLCVYWADIVEGTPLQPCIPIMYTLYNQDIPEANFFGYEVYSADSSIGGIIDALLKVINDFYAKTLMEIRDGQQLPLH